MRAALWRLHQTALGIGPPPNSDPLGRAGIALAAAPGRSRGTAAEEINEVQIETSTAAMDHPEVSEDRNTAELYRTAAINEVQIDLNQKEDLRSAKYHCRNPNWKWVWFQVHKLEMGLVSSS